MPTIVHEFDWPDRVVVGTIGRPGSRSFYLQVRAGARLVSVALEKEQSAVLADALGMHLDLFQRISVGPASVSIVRYGANRPDVVSTNTDSGDLGWLRAATPTTDAPVGGGS